MITKILNMNNNKRKEFSSSIILYFTLLILPFFIIPIMFSNIPFTEKTLQVISFFYSVFCFIISYFHYKKLNTLKSNMLKKYIKIFWSGILVLFTYFFAATIQIIPLLLINPDLSSIPLSIKTIYLSIFETFEVLVIIYILKDKIKKDIKDIQKNHKHYFANNLKYYLLAIIIMMISNLLISSINNGNIAGNEEAVRESFRLAPFYMYFSAVLIAPLLEELVFRQGIRNIFSNNTLFIIMSGLIFGGLHVLGNINSWIDLLYIIPYSVPGFAFAYILTKTNNIFVSTGFHFLHNGITMSLQILLMIFGI